MKKIMFNDRYGLTQAVIGGQKTMTRRVLKLSEEDEAWLDHTFDWDLCESDILDRYAQYKVEEVVAIAESYRSLNEKGYLAPEWLDHTCEDSAGYENKMFVRADLMPHRIRITDRKVERMQDISEEEALCEGVFFFNCGIDSGYTLYGMRENCGTAREAFAHLIDKVNKKGTWNRNPWVIAYSFKLMKGDDQ